MRPTLLMLLIIAGISLPPLAQAGGYGFSQPRLTWPAPAPDTATRDCSTATQVGEMDQPCPTES